jgi:hypothetical protein
MSQYNKHSEMGPRAAIDRDLTGISQCMVSARSTVLFAPAVVFQYLL